MFKMNVSFTAKIVFKFAGVALGILGLGIILTNLVMYLATYSHIYSPSEAPTAETVLIPGAAVTEDGELSPIFIDRIDTAIALYQANLVSKVLVSGDNSTIEYNEVSPVRRYLISKGIPDEDIFLDHAGFDTYSSMYRARDVFAVTSVLIVSQSFHLPRAVFLARMLGLEGEGVNADIGNILRRNYVREIFAKEKAMLDLFIQRKPKYLGDPIPITGDAPYSE